MTKILTLSIVLSLNSFLSFSQDSSLLMRPAYILDIAVDKKTVYEEKLQSGSYILPDKSLQIYPGETIFIEVDEEKGVVKNLKAVAQIHDSSKTLRISFTQDVKNKIHQMMILDIFNPFPYPLLYTAHMYLLNQKKWVATNVYPVEAQLLGIETWPDIIISLALGDWTLRMK